MHKGFANQLHLIYPKLMTELKKEPAKPIYITGHSQGGAVAAIATKAFVNDGLPVAATYTFAAPRSGDATYASSITTAVHRLEFGDDIVPHVPMRTSWPWWMDAAVQKANVDPKVKQALLRLAQDQRNAGVATAGVPGRQFTR